MAVKELTTVPDYIQRNMQQMSAINHLLGRVSRSSVFSWPRSAFMG